MIKILNKLFFQLKNYNHLHLSFVNIRKETSVEKIFNSIEGFSEESEIRYVGGCVRKIINKELVDDIDLAVNLTPNEVIKSFKKNNIRFYETGIEHGTITALINNKSFEITSLRKDVKTDGRHAKVEFSKEWKQDASRRDFTINSIYADIEGNLFDPFNGKKDLKDGKINFIGDPEKRIKEDYLRILRYIRFYLNYSKNKHDPNIIKFIKKNLEGIHKISAERLLNEFKKLYKSNGINNLSKDKFCCEIISLVFPQFKNIQILNNLDSKDFEDLDFIILISLLIIDTSDNTEYFLYKFRLSKTNEKRILFLKNFFSSSINKTTFTKKNLWKIFYFNGKESLLDLLNYQKLKSKKDNKKMLDLIKFFQDKKPPSFPVKANNLMEKYNISEGKELGIKLKKIEQIWLDNNFEISENEIEVLFKR